MKIVSTYSVKILNYNRILKDTARIYRSAVDFFIDVTLKEWPSFTALTHSNDAVSVMEQLTHHIAGNPSPRYDFDRDFYKFPSYLRRAAIMEAVGKVFSYKSNYANWESDKRGDRPGSPRAGICYPTMYRGNMFKETGEYSASIKIYRNHDWVWIDVPLKKGDMDYILHNCKNREKKSPTLCRRGKKWFLDFPFEESRDFVDVPLNERRILAVDLGINNACVCSAMTADGTIYGRKFLSLPAETDRLWTAINRIKKAQQHGARHIPGKWAVANGRNRHISEVTAQFIVDAALNYDVDVIVFEYLELSGKKRGSKKQKLHLWKAKHVQEIVTHKAHRNGIRISRVCAWNTSRLAFDGSGRVTRGEYDQNGETKYNYSICVFPTGKTYHCDLNASYNIGARYFIREILKSLSEKVRLDMEAKVPSSSRRSTSTLSTLIDLCAELAG